MEKYFVINVKKYNSSFDFDVYRPASLNYPKDNSVMFIVENFIQFADSLLRCKNSLVFWPENISVPEEINKRHAIYKCKDPRVEYGHFYKENKITYMPENTSCEYVNGAFISDKAIIGENVTIFPGTYIGGEVIIGNNVYIGSGVRLIGRVIIGDNVIIRENSVIGADGLSTNRDKNGETMITPQFGGIIIKDNVQIGALTVIARGAIDDTIIHEGVKIDNSCFISHNVVVGANTFIVGETIMFGSSSVGRESYISGNSTIRDGRHIGSHVKVGMGAVVTRDINDGQTVKGNPAR